jgi:hypothetical protein
MIPALHFNFSSLSDRPTVPKTGAIRLPRRLPLGSFLTLHGQLAAGESGIVTIEGAYTRPPWKVLVAVPSRNSSYEARLRLEHKGRLHLRVIYPDGHRAVGEVRVR